MNRKTKLAAAIALVCSASLAQATTYDVAANFYDGSIQGRTLFNGSFDWDGTTVSNFHGLLESSMWAWNTATQRFTSAFDGAGIVASPTYYGLVNNCTTSGCTGYAQNESPWLNLSYQLVTDYSNPNYVTVTTFKNNSTDVAAGGGYDVWGTDPDTDPNNAMAYGMPTNANRNNNGFFTLVFDRNNPTNTSLTWDQMVYTDNTRFGMMGPLLTGWLGMTGHKDYGAGVGSMGGYPSTLNITAAVPEPETYAMMMAGLGLVGWMSRRRKSAVATVAA
jgi:hypothetical protein